MASISPSGFAADRTGFVDLVGGAGFKTARAVVTALQSDGNGGTRLSLGASGQIDFVGVPVGTLKASRSDKVGRGNSPAPMLRSIAAIVLVAVIVAVRI